MAVVPDLSGTRDQFHRRQYFHAGRRGGRIDLGWFMHIRIHCALYLWPCWVSVAVQRLSLVSVSVGHSSWGLEGFSLQCLLLLQSTGSRCSGFSAGSVVVTSGLSRPVACWIRTRDWTSVLQTTRQILNPCTTREVLLCTFIGITSAPPQIIRH